MKPGYVSIKEDVLKKLEANLPEIRKRLGIDTIGIFGSVSRGEDFLNSDVDVLYLFEEGRGNLHEFIGLRDYLEELFHRKVDLVSIEYIDKYIKPYITADALIYGSQRVIA